MMEFNIQPYKLGLFESHIQYQMDWYVDWVSFLNDFRSTLRTCRLSFWAPYTQWANYFHIIEVLNGHIVTQPSSNALWVWGSIGALCPQLFMCNTHLFHMLNMWIVVAKAATNGTYTRGYCTLMTGSPSLIFGQGYGRSKHAVAFNPHKA